MTQEEKYDKALKIARNVLDSIDDNYVCTNLTKEDIKEMYSRFFPELKESNDEKIRKALIDGFTVMKESKNCSKTFSNHNIPVADILAWLEKQGEKGLDDKVELKFNVGEWVVNKFGNVWHIDSFDKKNYQVSNGIGNYNWFPISKQDELNFWTIQDAKDGDVLACESGWTCIFKTLDNHTDTFSSYCFMDNTKWFCETGSECHTLKEEFVKAYNGKIYPATKEQRDLFFQKMKEAGYEWNAEKKKLSKCVIDEGKSEIDYCFTKMMNDEKISSIWSEEDERIILAISQLLKDCESENGWNCVYSNDREVFFADIENYLQSLKNRIVLQSKQEWSEEDKNRFNNLIFLVECSNENEPTKKGFINFINRLKSLRSWKQWKPTEEQLNIIDMIFTDYAIDANVKRILKELKEQLKQL